MPTFYYCSYIYASSKQAIAPYCLAIIGKNMMTLNCQIYSKMLFNNICIIYIGITKLYIYIHTHTLYIYIYIYIISFFEYSKFNLIQFLYGPNSFFRRFSGHNLRAPYTTRAASRVTSRA